MAFIKLLAEKKFQINDNGWITAKRTKVSHTFIFVYMREFGHYVLFGVETKEKITGKLLELILCLKIYFQENSLQVKAIIFRLTM